MNQQEGIVLKRFVVVFAFFMLLNIYQSLHEVIIIIIFLFALYCPKLINKEREEWRVKKIRDEIVYCWFEMMNVDVE